MKTNLYENINDNDLLERFYKSDDQQWVGILLERYTMLLLGVCMKYLKNEEEVKVESSPKASASPDTETADEKADAETVDPKTEKVKEVEIDPKKTKTDSKLIKNKIGLERYVKLTIT